MVGVTAFFECFFRLVDIYMYLSDCLKFFLVAKVSDGNFTLFPFLECILKYILLYTLSCVPICSVADPIDCPDPDPTIKQERNLIRFLSLQIFFILYLHFYKI